MSTSSISFPEEKVVSTPSEKNIWRVWLIWALAALFYFYDNLLQVSPSAMKPELSLVFANQAEQFGSLSAYCLYAYGLMQIPAGILMDRFGPRRILTLACVFCSLGSLAFGLATSLWEAKFGRVLIGVGASFAFVGGLKVVSHWFPSNRFALITGLTVTVGFLGAAFGLSTVSKIVETFGWRHSMQLGGMAGILLSILIWIIIRDKVIEQKQRAEVTSVPTSSSSSGKKIFQGFLQVLQHKQTWIAALYAGLMFVPTLAFGGLWGIPFLVEAHGFDRESAGLCISLIYVGWMFGCPIWGFISDYIKRRNLPMMVATLITLVNCIAVIYLKSLPLPILGTLLFCLGFFSSGFVLAFTVVQEGNPAAIASTAIGFTNALNTLWGALAQRGIGRILDMSHVAPVLDSVTGERIFSLAEYQQALLALPIALIISFILLFFLKETFCQSRQI